MAHADRYRSKSKHRNLKVYFSISAKLLANLLLARICGPYLNNTNGMTLSTTPRQPKTVAAQRGPRDLYIGTMKRGKAPPNTVGRTNRVRVSWRNLVCRMRRRNVDEDGGRTVSREGLSCEAGGGIDGVAVAEVVEHAEVYTQSEACQLATMNADAEGGSGRSWTTDR